MEKDIKDYLHLYLGQKVIHEKYPDTQMTIYHISKDGSVVMGRSDEFQELEPHHKLVLRPLSDMIEEEAIECAKLSEYEPHFRDVKVERTRFNDIVVKWDGMVEGGEQQNITGDPFYCAEQFQYLLRKGFDLFELITYGLAIEKKLNNESNVKECDATKV